MEGTNPKSRTMKRISRLRKRLLRIAHQAANSCMLPVRGEFRCKGAQ